jgi:UDP-N-acetylmuramoyl-L-alanyl-D-glutamate--2,6-diaminopimelate ligase
VDRKITGITADSRMVKPGFAFVAVKGLASDGHDFISDAIDRGATTIYGEKDLKLKGVKYIRVKSAKETLGQLASEFYGNPSSKLKVIGVTGTKGKTTTCHLIHHILTKLGHKTGLITSITTQGFHTTTPDVVSLNKELSEMVKDGYEYAVLEVSSHGIDQGRGCPKPKEIFSTGCNEG